MWNLRTKNKQIEKQDRYREQIGGCRGWGVERVGEMGEGSQKVQTSSYKINKC